MTQLFANNASSYITVELLVGTTSITVDDGVAFPLPTGGDHFLVTLHDPVYADWEVVKVTTRSGNSFTSLLRGYEGSAKAWPVGTLVSTNITKETLELFQTAAAAAQAAADAAQVDADDALTQLSEGGTSGATVTRSFDGFAFDAVTGIDESYATVGYFCLEDGVSNVAGAAGGAVNNYTGDSADFPLSLGFTTEGINKIQVFRNGVKQLRGDSDAAPYGAADGTWTWHGHKWLHMTPLLNAGDVIEVLGFAADVWTAPNEQVTSYSYQCGAEVGSGSAQTTTNRFNWANHTKTGNTALSYAGYDGSGGSTDGTNGRVFGATNARKHWAKMLLSTETWTFFSNGLALDADRGGCGTDGAASYIFGCGAWQDIQKVSHTTDVDSVITPKATNGYIWGDACSNAGQTFGLYLPGAVTTRFEKYKLIYATEALSVTTTGSAAFNNWRDYGLHTFYDDIGYFTTGGVKKINFSTEVWSDSAISYATTNFRQINSLLKAHDGVCDGGSYLVGRMYKMAYPSEVCFHYVPFDIAVGSTTAQYNHVGAFSDSWGASK